MKYKFRLRPEKNIKEYKVPRSDNAVMKYKVRLRPDNDAGKHKVRSTFRENTDMLVTVEWSAPTRPVDHPVLGLTARNIVHSCVFDRWHVRSIERIKEGPKGGNRDSR